MAYYQNQNTFAVAVPTAGGVDVTLFTGEVVEGDVYSIFDYHNLLVLVPGPYTYPVLRYSWPASGGGSGGSGTLTGVTCISPIVGGGISGVVSVGLSPLGVTGSYIANGTITANKIAAGALVTGVLVGSDTLTDLIELIAGTNIVLTPDAVNNTVTISTDPNVVSSVTATLPLSATVTAGVADLSIAIDTTNDGGAVALQAVDVDPVVIQSGAAGLTYLYTDGFLSANVPQSVITGGAITSGFYVKPKADTDYVYSAFSYADVLLSYLDDNGDLFTTHLVNKTDVKTVSLSLFETPWSGGTAKLLLSSATADYDNNFVGVPFKLYDTLTLAQDEGTVGRIVGSPTWGTLLALGTDGLYPAIKLGTTSETSADLALAVYNNGTGTPTIGLYTDGTITCKRVVAQYETHTNIYLTAGNYVVANYPGVSTFVCESASGISSFTLPELTQDSVNGQTYVFKKYDVTSNAIIIIPSAGQTIDQTLTQYTLSARGNFVRLQAVIVGGGVPKQFWITC